MDFVFTLVYAAIYFAGYYGAHLANLAMRRVLFSNLRLAGLGLVALVAAIVAILIEVKAPPNASAFAKGNLQGQFAIGPALIVGIFVGIRMWVENRKLGKLKRPGE